MVRIRYIIVSDSVELRGVVGRLRTVRYIAQEVIADPCPRSLTIKQAVFMVDRERLFSEYLRFPLAVSSHECSRSLHWLIADDVMALHFPFDPVIV